MTTDGLTPPDPQTMPIDALLRQAHLLLRRDEAGDAESRCRIALEREPDNAEALELLGDVRRARGFFQDAITQYRRALELRPDRGLLEEKIARAALGQYEDARERADAEMLLASPSARAERRRAGLLAVLLSVVCAGAGHLLQGQKVKGGILMAIYILGVSFGFTEMFKMMLSMFGALPPTETVNGPMALFGFAAIVTWIYALIDVAAQRPPRSVPAPE